MKYFFTAVCLLICSISFAQQKTTDKAEIKTQGLWCDACKERVEQALFKQYGIISYKVDIKKKTVTVSWITDRTDIEQIKTMIANAGFDADDVTKEEDAFKRLPPCCKTPPADPKKPN